MAESVSLMLGARDSIGLREKVLEARQRTLGSEHHDTTLGAMYNLAISYCNLGRHQKAMDLMEKVLAWILIHCREPRVRETFSNFSELSNQSTE